MKILLADDHEMVRDTMAAFLEQEDDMSTLTCADVPSAVAQIQSLGAFDLVLLDYTMPGMGGLQGLTEVIAANDGRPVAIMSGTADKSTAQKALDMGAKGFLPKTMGAKSLVNAIRFMSSGETFAPITFMTQEDNADEHPLAKDLTKRETEVLEALCRGQSNKEIAEELGLKEVTIKLHVKTLCRKIDAKNRTHAAMIAKQTGIF